MPIREAKTQLSKLWPSLIAAEESSSQTWVLSGRYREGIRVYSPSLGPLRRIVEIAEVASSAFGEYIENCSPIHIRRLLNIAQAAKDLSRFLLEPPTSTGVETDAREKRFMQLRKVLDEALSHMEFPE